MGKRCGRSFPGVCEAVGSSHPSQVLYALPNTQTHPGVPCAAKLLMLKHRRWIQQGKRGRSLCDSEHLVRPQGFVSPWIPAQGGGVQSLLPGLSHLFSHRPSPLHGGRGGWTRRALSAPQSSSASRTGLIIIISLKTSRAAIDKKVPSCRSWNLMS